MARAGFFNRPLSEYRNGPRTPIILITPPPESNRNPYMPNIDIEALRDNHLTTTRNPEPDPRYLCPPPNTFRSPRHTRTPSMRAKLGKRDRLKRNCQALIDELARETKELKDRERGV
ncbi:MAG: hypothetical protein Q9200_004181, partial [Gallowayella weberi]